MNKLSKSQNTSTKLQINLKLQCPTMTKISLQRFEVLNFGHCDLFVICVLLFEISIVFSLFLLETLFCNRYLCRVNPYHLNGCTSSPRTLTIIPDSPPATAASTPTAWALTQQSASSTTTYDIPSAMLIRR